VEFFLIVQNFSSKLLSYSRITPPAENGFFFKINPTINRIEPEALAELFLDSLKVAD
jgi:hypothetical protein